jgi:hypothetical protein
MTVMNIVIGHDSAMVIPHVKCGLHSSHERCEWPGDCYDSATGCCEIHASHDHSDLSCNF